MAIGKGGTGGPGCICDLGVQGGPGDLHGLLRLLTTNGRMENGEWKKCDPDGPGGTRGPSIPGGSGGPFDLGRQNGWVVWGVKVVQVVRMISLDDMHSEKV